ncbi:hypothetical protein [Actinoplanes couchii]|uniref:Uncharacterized protein n=1 Tax=Actinoplanes couchii TaxID=403638 RepID=A0ABQ3WZD0_9ACTN|nr:hypothetical protein [Actinoplanes couchii]MDR6316022.1 hypothetical protein [Actinoplanes couchii]GID51635.1 hypothetical protein Aco03nite_000390 [Actinoplanes couchii]
MREGRQPGRALLRRAVRGEARSVGLSSILSAAHQGGEALVPILIGVIIDQTAGGGTTGDLILWIAVLGATFAILSASFQYGTRTGETRSRKPPMPCAWSSRRASCTPAARPGPAGYPAPW